MSDVFVLDTNKRPLNPLHPGRARRLLSSGKAAVFRSYPFTIILNHAVESPSLEPLRIKIDPGSKTTGFAVVNDTSGKVIFAAELAHHGQAIKQALDRRRAVRRSRRQRQTRYRQPRFANRRRKAGWLPPSLESRMANTQTWVRRFIHLCLVNALSIELVKFDTQAIETPDIEGIGYQQGTLYGYEIREYLLEKWKRQCAYCGAKDLPFQVEHIVARANGGTNRLSNLTLACASCNLKKGTRPIQDVLKRQPAVLQHLLAQAKAPLKDAAAVNATCKELSRRLQLLGLPIEEGTGGRTKYNRTQRGLPKAHWIDAACVGESTPKHLDITGIVPLLIKSNGWGSRQMCRMDRYGFPRTGPKQAKKVSGFQTGDIVQAVVIQGSKTGIYTGRVAIRSRGSFNIATKQGVVQGIHHRYCRIIHHVDGYSYQKGSAAFPPRS